MGKVIVLNHLSLDGVMQAPASPDEDTRGGFVTTTGVVIATYEPAGD